MGKYWVTRYEIHKQRVLVDDEAATSPEEALRLIVEGEISGTEEYDENGEVTEYVTSIDHDDPVFGYKVEEFHSCPNCLGVDPNSCLFNQERTK